MCLIPYITYPTLINAESDPQRTYRGHEWDNILVSCDRVPYHSATMNRDKFVQYVEETLDHLYDHPYLETHPLAHLLVGNRIDEPRSHELQRLLLHAIQELRPPPDLPYSSLGWRKYRYLHLRYGESMSAAQVADELSITPRHLRRGHREAITAVASVLWDRHPKVWTAEIESKSAAAPREHEWLEEHRSLLSQEVARLGGASGLALTPFRETLEGVLATVAPLARARGTQVKIVVPEDQSGVAIDRTVLRQVLLNLLITAIEICRGEVEVAAIQYTGSIDVRIKSGASVSRPTEHETAAQSLLTDHNPFQRRLDVSRRLVEQRGGALEVAAERSGLRLLLRLPTAEPLTVLVIDDNEDVVRLFERYLAGGIYRVITALTGADALRLAHDCRPAIITLDLMMPSQDGWEILQGLKAHPETRDIPVIVCSVLQELELASLLGAADFLAKPITQEALLGSLARCQSATVPSARQSLPPDSS